MYKYLTIKQRIMVSTINVTVDDEQFQKTKAVKDAHGWTWEEFIANATEELDVDD